MIRQNLLRFGTIGWANLLGSGTVFFRMNAQQCHAMASNYLRSSSPMPVALQRVASFFKEIPQKTLSNWLYALDWLHKACVQAPKLAKEACNTRREYLLDPEIELLREKSWDLSPEIYGLQAMRSRLWEQGRKIIQPLWHSHDHCHGRVFPRRRFRFMRSNW